MLEPFAEAAYNKRMDYFFTLEQDLPAGVGFELWGSEHIVWLCFAATIAAGLCLLYRGGNANRRKTLRIAAGCAVLALEFAKDINLVLQGGMDVYTLPLHLCGLAVFFTFFHSLRPENTVGNFLYSTCMPGAAFALACPDWTWYPAFSYVSIVAFLVHTFLVAYPLMLLSGGDLRREAKRFPFCFLILVVLAIPIYFFDRHFGANYMFLLWPSPGSPLEWFASLLGVPGYLLGYFPLMAVVWTLLYLPYGKKINDSAQRKEAQMQSKSEVK